MSDTMLRTDQLKDHDLIIISADNFASYACTPPAKTRVSIARAVLPLRWRNPFRRRRTRAAPATGRATITQAQPGGGGPVVGDDRVVHGVEGFGGPDRVVADSLDAEQAPVGVLGYGRRPFHSAPERHVSVVC
jgi:hypothetical protein